MPHVFDENLKETDQADKLLFMGCTVILRKTVNTTVIVQDSIVSPDVTGIERTEK